MSKKSCEFVREILIEYDDGELKAKQAAEVAQHLAACALCREELQDLRDSLKLARDVWHESAVNIEDIPITLASAKRPIVLRRLAAVAACLALAVGLTVLIWTSRTRQTPGPLATVQVPPAVRAARLIEREAASAKLAASAQILADSPGGQEFASAAFQYLAQTYPQTAMGKQALNKISSN
ncbi:MAG: zf-HC2 domain-containing protein [Phycisphaerae bacterium]|nr:zf-HC2 domain-containing protein [Phycisphaerae bacterium]